MVRDTLPISKKTTDKSTPFPKSIAFIVSNEFCERFNFYGMRTILVLYMRNKLDYDDDASTVLFHIFTMLVYFFPLIGAIVADSWLGKFKTILGLSVVYAIGSVVISVGAIPTLNLPAKLMTTVGLVLIAAGTGGIKPCVSAFGGDQFKIPEQVKQLATFFSLFYFAINAGSLISTTITPILREDVHCFNELECFSLAFGVPGALMIISIVIFVLGKPMYVITKPSGNMLVEVSKCIGNAIKSRSSDPAKRDHWLDYAEPKYGKQLVDEVKILLKVLVLYIPLPVFWALFDQQGSRWTFQATRMTGDVGYFTIKPDQMQVINPLLILAFIPLFNWVFYPILEKIGIKRPLQKLTLGMLCAAVAFVISGFVELELMKTYPVLPKAGEGQLRIFNGQPCTYNVITNIPGHEKIQIRPFEMFKDQHIAVENTTSYMYSLDPVGNCPPMNGTLDVRSETAMSYFIHQDNSTLSVIEYEDKVDKSKSGYPNVRILAQTTMQRTIEFRGVEETIKFMSIDQSLHELVAGKYDILVDGEIVSAVHLKLGGMYTVVINENHLPDRIVYRVKAQTITEPNSMNMLWLLPQYIIITAGEVMFSVTGLEFTFTQAPVSMKSVLQACWLLTVAFGNLIVVVIAKARFVESQAIEFFVFAGMMLVVMFIFILMAMRYKYVNSGEDSDMDSFAMDDPKSDENATKMGISNAAFFE